MSAPISVIIPVYNDAERLGRLLDALRRQQVAPAETIVVDDGSGDASADVAVAAGVRCLRQPGNRGPAAARNAGARAAGGEILAFTDSDCTPHPDWIGAVGRHLSEEAADALMGRVLLPPSTRLGDAISALGFPAGGSVGFERIWPVAPDGCTVSLSTCNCAIRADRFHHMGGFDRRFPFAGGEDSYLAYRIVAAGRRILYCPDMVVTHDARDDLSGFLRWQYRRGMSSFVFSRLVTDRRRFVALRRWSTRNVLSAARRDGRLPLVAALLAAGTAVQLAGFIAASRSRSIHANLDHQPAVAR